MTGNVVELDDTVDIEKIDEFSDDRDPVELDKIEETRMAKINIKLRWSCF